MGAILESIEELFRKSRKEEILLQEEHYRHLLESEVPALKARLAWKLYQEFRKVGFCDEDALEMAKIAL